MSKTDKDRPYAVRAFFEGEIQHNHTSGECRVETLKDATKPRYKRWRHKCPRREYVPSHCPGASLRDTWRTRCYRAFHELENIVHDAREREDYDTVNYMVSRYTNRKRYCNDPHYRVVWHNDRPCDVCDEPQPTCYRMLGWRDRPYSHVPQWFVNHSFTRPERQRIRAELNDIKKAYNSDWGIWDEIDVNSPQHRHRASWYWY